MEGFSDPRGYFIACSAIPLRAELQASRLELFDDEKAITRRAGGDRLWSPGHLTLELLRCERTATPLVWEPCGHGHRLLVVENQATFHSTLRVLRSTSKRDYGGVAWGQGTMAPSRIAYAAQLPFELTAIDYFGDLDLEGLATAQATCTAASEAGLPAAPQVRLWSRLLTFPPVRSTPATTTQAAEAVMWLPAPLRDQAMAILTAGMRIPQERLGYERLAADHTWMVTA